MAAVAALLAASEDERKDMSLYSEGTALGIKKKYINCNLFSMIIWIILLFVPDL